MQIEKLYRKFKNSLDKATFLQISLVLIIITLLTYLNCLSNGFVWDDEEQIINNATMNSLSNISQIFGGSTFNTGGAEGMSGIYYRPLMMLSFMVNKSIWGENAFGFHIFQILIHAINGILVYTVFGKTFKSRKIRKWKLISFIASIIFIVHPGINEAVVYIASTQEVIYTLFALLAIKTAIFNVNTKGQKHWIYFSIFFFLSLMGKESAVFIAPIVLLYYFLFKKDKLNHPFIYSLISLCIYFVMRFSVADLNISRFDIAPINNASLIERLMTLPYIMFSYLRTAFMPIYLSITQHFVIRNPGDIRFWGSILVLAIVIFGLLYANRKIRADKRLLLFFGAWFLAPMSLLMNVYPLDMSLAERWLYFPMVGLIGFVALLIYHLTTGKKINVEKLSILILIIMILLSTRTVVRNTNWKDGLTLFGHDALRNKDAYDLENNYATELFRVGEIEKAKEHFERSIELAPTWTISHSNLGAVYEQLGDDEKAEEQYLKSLEFGDYYLAVQNMATLYMRQERYEEAIDFCSEQVMYRPYNPLLNFILAKSYYEMGNLKDAEEYAKKTYQLSKTQEVVDLLNQIQDDISMAN